MRNNEKNKFIYFIMSAISISIALSFILLFSNLLNVGAGSSYINFTQGLIANEYYVSKSFDEYLMPSIVKSLETSVSEDSKDKNTERAKLNNINNIQFFVVNKDTGETYSNTSYTTEKDFKSSIDDYCNVQIINEGRGYIKNVDSKKIENYDSDSGRFEINSKNIYIYASFPKTVTEGDEVYENYYYYNKYKSMTQTALSVIVVSVTIFIISSLLYKYNKSNMYKFSKSISIELGLAMIVCTGMFLTKNLNNIKLFQSVLLSINIFITIMISIDVMEKIKHHKGIYNTLKSCFISRYLSKHIYKFMVLTKDILLLKKILVSGIIAIFFNVLGLYLDIVYSKYIFIFLFSTLSIALITIYLIVRLSYLNHIMNSTNKIKNGRYDYKIKIKGSDNFTQLAENINNMGANQNRVIEEKLINERLKLKFIYNIGTLIKTNITTPDVNFEEINALTDEILELSNLNQVNIIGTTIDLVKLINKKLQDKKEENINSNLDVIFSTPNEEVFISYTESNINRILDKILDNVYRFSLHNTRVYINIEKEDIKSKLVIKNISSSKINYEPSEVNREYTIDSAIQIEQSNSISLLDLSYLVKNHGGEIKIEVDGDLFKLSIIF